jgi:hypothetical protein
VVEWPRADPRLTTWRTKGVTLTMKKAFTVVAIAVSLALTSGVALASSCPKVIKQGRDAAAKMKADDPSGKHAESLAKANEALADLGVK